MIKRATDQGMPACVLSCLRGQTNRGATKMSKRGSHAPVLPLLAATTDSSASLGRIYQRRAGVGVGARHFLVQVSDISFEQV
jgi:hypothetical protein